MDENLLMVAASEHCADMLYAVRVFAPDPFIYLRLHGRCRIIVSDLEIDRMRGQVDGCEILSLTECRSELRKQGVSQPTTAHIIRCVLRRHGIGSVTVPQHFPIGLAQDLRRLRVRIRVRRGDFFARRSIKNAEEVKKISAALIMAEVGLAEGIQAIRSSKVGRNGKLVYHNVPLTSEKLRGIIETAILQAGGHVRNTIVAGGRQGCDPHERGHGVLRAREPIILDVFPRSQKTGYFGDITRTVVKGHAREGLRKLYHTVERAQELAFSQLHAKANPRSIHHSLQEYFAEQGYRTGIHEGRMQGFFHSTGHGVGLELHESPSLGPQSRESLRAGHVVTLEPGLYYPELGGGVRLEDVALVMARGAKNLTKFEKVLEV